LRVHEFVKDSASVPLSLHGIAAIRVFLNVFREKDLFEIRKRQAGLAANRTDQA
jgi:hypothetical protein